MLFALALALQGPVVQVEGPIQIGSTEDYVAVTSTQDEVSNLETQTFTPLVFDSDGNLWALNPFASTVAFYDASVFATLAGGGTPSLEPTRILTTGLNPASIAVYEPAGGDRKILVACAGTRGVFRHDAATGNIEDYVPLRSANPLGAPWKPLISSAGDIVIDHENDWALVSCITTNAVVKIDLATFQITDTYPLPVGQRPGPLCLDTGGAGPEDNTVLVAMTVTGNQSIFLPDPTLPPPLRENSPGRVIDLELEWPSANPQPSDFPNEALPTNAAIRLTDDDLYEIDPTADTVTPVAKGLGSLLFELEQAPNEIDGERAFWVLSQESNNKDPNRDTEPKIKGDVATHLLTRLERGAGLTLDVASEVDIDLAQLNGGSPLEYHVDRTINQPHALAFSPGTGIAMVASPFRDHIVSVLNSNATNAGTRALGNPFYELPRNAQCRDIELDASERWLVALCLGSMTVEVFDRVELYTPPIVPIQPAASFELGLDPTNDQVRRGRAVFYNGLFSEHGRTSCASCHPAGRSDQLGWMIAGEPLDHKNVMLTQSLMGIADTFPHHWRGERDLKDFQKAFVGLLGADSTGSGTPTEEPTNAQMDDFIAYLQSLQAPSNPNQNPHRVLDDTRRNDFGVLQEQLAFPTEIANSSVLGSQQVFNDKPNFAANACGTCHDQVTGSDGNMTVELGSPISRENKIENTHLRELQHRDYDVVRILDPSPQNQIQLFVNQNGFGATHKGGSGFPHNGSSIVNFVMVTGAFNVPMSGIGGLTEQEQMDIVRFIDQFDQGTSPAAQWARFTDGSTTPNQFKATREILVDGFARGEQWNDVVVLGHLLDTSGNPSAPVRAVAEDDGSGGVVFRPDFPVTPAQLAGLTFGFLRSLVENDQAELLFMGVPAGSGERMAIDWDRDGVVNAVDATPWEATAFADDGSAPSVVSFRRDFETARVVKYHVEFSEDVTYRVEYTPIGASAPLVFDSVRGGQTPGIYDFVDKDTFVLTHSNPSGADKLPASEVPFDVRIFLTDRFGNPQSAASGIDLGSFTPLPGDDQDGANLVEFMHVDRIVLDPPPPALSGFEGFRVRFALRENDTVPGTSQYQPAVGVRPIVTIGLENQNPQPGEAPFLLLDTTSVDFQTSGDLVFETFDVMAMTWNPYVALDDYVVGPVTAANGEATIDLYFANLPAGQDIKVAVQDAGRDEGLGASPPRLTDIFELQNLKLEDSMEIRIQR